MSKIKNIIAVIVPILLVLFGITVYGIYTDKMGKTELITESAAQEIKGTVVEQKDKDFINYYYAVEYTDEAMHKQTCILSTFNPNVVKGDSVQLYLCTDGTIHIPLTEVDRYVYLVGAIALIVIGVILEGLAFIGVRKANGTMTEKTGGIS